MTSYDELTKPRAEGYKQREQPVGEMFYSGGGSLQPTELGKRVWTRFDTLGMFGGATVLFLVLISRLPFDGTSINVRRGHA